MESGIVPILSGIRDRLNAGLDEDTIAHQRRTQAYVAALLNELMRQPAFRSKLSPGEGMLVEMAAGLHDIGKSLVSGAVLQKPGPLDLQEYAQVQAHTRHGVRLLQATRREWLARLPAVGEHDRRAVRGFFCLIRQAALCHHERWDGRGYPYGLAGERIPLVGRLTALADVYDALSAPRCYKPAMGIDEVHQRVIGGRGSLFDPAMVDAYLASRARFEATARGAS